MKGIAPLFWNIYHTGENPNLFFRKGSGCMILIRRHQAHAEQGQGINEKEMETLETVRKIVAIVKAAAKRKENKQLHQLIESVKNPLHKLMLRREHSAKQEKAPFSLIRIQLEEIKRKVRIASPAALQFIGPGDH